jgi:GMP synthase-like glutamine amidotransferase
MAKIAIIENGPSLDSRFAAIARGLGHHTVTARPRRGEVVPEDCDAFILTGDLHNITDGLKEYHRRELDLLERLDGRRVFASCFSHQLIAHWRGGEVRRRQERLLRWETGRVTEPHPALEGISRFEAVFFNIDEVAGTPPGATVHAVSDGCASLVLSYGEDILTCQGHPEMAVRAGSMRTGALALVVAGGPGRSYMSYRRSRPPELPADSPFMESVIRWLT